MFYLNYHVSTQTCRLRDVSHNFLCFISTTMFPRSVLTTRRVHVHVRALRDGVVHTFLTYEVMSMRNFKHITPCLSHNFPQVHSKQSTTSRLFKLVNHSHYATFDLHGRLRVQIVTYEDGLFATCHLISHVLSRLPRFHTNVSPTRRIHAHFRTLQDECLHSFDLRRHVYA